jgi:hypothetical protein
MVSILKVCTEVIRVGFVILPNGFIGLCHDISIKHNYSTITEVRGEFEAVFDGAIGAINRNWEGGFIVVTNVLIDAIIANFLVTNLSHSIYKDIAISFS